MLQLLFCIDIHFLFGKFFLNIMLSKVVLGCGTIYEGISFNLGFAIWFFRACFLIHRQKQTIILKTRRKSRFDEPKGN